jgi:hypothetical protein
VWPFVLEWPLVEPFVEPLFITGSLAALEIAPAIWEGFVTSRSAINGNGDYAQK